MVFVEAGIVANLLGYKSSNSFLQHRLRLEQEHGFPQPLPTSLSPLRWRREAVEAWRDSIGWADGTTAQEPAGQARLMKRAARA